MKPEIANLFTINATGQQGDFVISFYYEWQDTDDGMTTELKKQKVASVVMSLSDFIQLTDVICEIKTQIDEIKAQEGSDTP